MRPTLEKKLIYNTELLSNPLYEPEFINHAFLRFHSFGELANSTMLHNMIKLAKFNPHCQFVLWTKRIDIIRAYYKDRFYPDNFRVIYSNPRIDSPMTESDIPEGFHAVFNVFSAEYAIQHNIDINCSGKSCQTCMNCYKSVKMPNKIINEVIKSQAKKYQSSNPA